MTAKTTLGVPLNADGDEVGKQKKWAAQCHSRDWRPMI